ncbi:MAG: phenyltransferase domain-containing protein [Desulfobacteraceae bacterium]|nr:MAG: phenyltransferase domain-containing protein [Desulfobacteraceae bacterium]
MRAVTPLLQPGLDQHKVSVDFHAVLDLILSTQQADGAIPWWPGHKTDPWDHVESAMGLTIGGAYAEARRAFDWMKEAQLPDGSWYAAYTGGSPTDHTRETNHAAYVAVGVYHYYLSTQDLDFVKRMWPVVSNAIDFAVRHQNPSGEIYWAVSPHGRVDRMALVTGCSSISFSLKCALALARVLGKNRPKWRQALLLLQACLESKPHRFNTTKARFSMDWFYPILCGAITGQKAQHRLDSYWKKFVVQDMGVRCVSDRPWVTVAESCELILTLGALGDHQKAAIVYRWICDRTFEDGTFWCGFTFPDMVVWPEEKISWTNAAVLMAADALFALTPAGHLFSHEYWLNMEV